MEDPAGKPGAPAQPAPPAPQPDLPALVTARPLEPARGDDELRKLLKERSNTAVRELRATDQEFRAGRILWGRVFDSSRRVLHGQLELADRPAERVAAYEKYLDFIKEVEKLMLAGFNAGRIKPADMEMTLYMRQDAEVLLLRAQRKAGGARPR
jgi:hypothetical protein